MSALRRFIMVMGLLLYVPSALPAQEQDWNQLIEGARREGKVVVSGPPNPDVRRDLPARFKKRFGIPLESIGGRSSVLAGKLRVERRVGTFTVDVAISGTETAATIFYAEKMIEPLRHVPDHVLIPQPGTQYFEFDWDFIFKHKKRVIARMGELLR